MSKANEILNFYFASSDFINRSKKVIPISLKSQLELRIAELGKIKATMGEMSFQFNEEKLIPGVFIKFKRSISSNNVMLDIRELRTLTYSLYYSEQNLTSIFSNENELIYALTLLESNWRDSFLVGLIDCFLKNWETKYHKSLELLEKFITNKLENYKGNRSTLISFKNNKRFFNTKNGDLILGDTIAK